MALKLWWHMPSQDKLFDESLPDQLVISSVAHYYSAQKYYCRVQVGILSSQPKIYSGEYVFKLVRLNAPKQMMRVQMRVFNIFDDVSVADLPWAIYCLLLDRVVI